MSKIFTVSAFKIVVVVMGAAVAIELGILCGVFAVLKFTSIDILDGTLQHMQCILFFFKQVVQRQILLLQYLAEAYAARVFEQVLKGSRDDKTVRTFHRSVAFGEFGRMSFSDGVAAGSNCR